MYADTVNKSLRSTELPRFTELLRENLTDSKKNKERNGNAQVHLYTVTIRFTFWAWKVEERRRGVLKSGEDHWPIVIDAPHR